MNKDAKAGFLPPSHSLWVYGHWKLLKWTV
jgi:hypothetical protein